MIFDKSIYLIFNKKCKCLNGYHGDDCGIPSYIWKTGNNAKLLPNIIRRRKVPRRVIYAVPVNHEFELFETRMAMQADVVDVFILHESNYTNSGHPKPRLFFNKFQNDGWLSKYFHKFVYIFQETFPEEGKLNGEAITINSNGSNWSNLFGTVPANPNASKIA